MVIILGIRIIRITQEAQDKFTFIQAIKQGIKRIGQKPYGLAVLVCIGVVTLTSGWEFLYDWLINNPL